MAAAKLTVLVLAAVILAQFVSWPYLDQIALVLVGLLVAGYAWSKSSLRRLGVVRETASDRVQVGQTLRERIELRNGGRLAKLWLEVRDYSSLPGHSVSRVVHVRGRGAARWTVETFCTQRGRFRMGPLVIASGDPFGLFPTTLRIPGSHDVLVYPAIYDLSAYPLPPGRLTAGATMTKRTPFITPSVSGIREYLPGDAFGRISWTASARLGRLMVKEFDLDPTADVWVVLDLDKGYHRVAGGDRARDPAAPWLTSTEEYAVTIAASLVRRCLGEGRNVGLCANAGRAAIVPPDRTDRQELKILELLATIQADGTRPLAEALLAETARFRDRSTLLVVTPSTDETWVGALAEVAGRRARTAAIVVEAATFAPADPPLLVVGALAAAGVPAHLIKFGDDVAAALASPRAMVPTAAGNMVRYG